MSATIVCPSCGNAVMFRALPANRCPSCGEPLPDALREAVDSALRKEPLQRPALLTAGMVFCALFAVIFALTLVCAPFDRGNYSIDGEPVSGPEFLRRAGIVFGSVVVLNGLIAFGLYQHQAWTRPLMVVFWAVPFAVAALNPSEANPAACSIAFGVLAMGIAALYLYAKKNVRAYYEAIGRRERVESGG